MRRGGALFPGLVANLGGLRFSKEKADVNKKTKNALTRASAREDNGKLFRGTPLKVKRRAEEIKKGESLRNKLE